MLDIRTNHERMHQIGTSVYESTYEELQEICALYGARQASVIRAVLEKYLPDELAAARHAKKDGAI